MFKSVAKSTGAIKEQNIQENKQDEEDYENIQEETIETDEFGETFLFKDFKSLQKSVEIMNETLENECNLLLNSVSSATNAIPLNANNINDMRMKIHQLIFRFNTYFNNLCILWLNEYSFSENPNSIKLGYIINNQITFIKGHYSAKLMQYENIKQRPSMIINTPLREESILEKRMGAFSYGFICNNANVDEFMNQLNAKNITHENRNAQITGADGNPINVFELNLIAELLIKSIFEKYKFPENFLFINIPFPKTAKKLHYFPSSALNMLTTEVYKFKSQESFEHYKRDIMQRSDIYGLLSILGKPQNKIFKFNKFGEIPILEPNIESILELKKIERFVGNAYYPSMLCRKLYEILKQTRIINIEEFDFSKLNYVLSTGYVSDIQYKINHNEMTLEDFLSIYIDGIYSLFTSPQGLPSLDSLLFKLIYNMNSENTFCVQCGGGAFKIVGDIGKKNDCDSRLYVLTNNANAYSGVVNSIKVEFMKLIFYLEGNNYFNEKFVLCLGDYWIEITKKEIRFREHTLTSGFPAHLLSIDVVELICIKRNNAIIQSNGNIVNEPGTEICCFDHYSAVFDIVIKEIKTKSEFEYVKTYKMDVQIDAKMQQQNRGVNNYSVIQQSSPESGVEIVKMNNSPISSDLIQLEKNGSELVYIMNLLALLKTILETFESPLNLYNRALQGKITKDIERIEETLKIFEQTHSINISKSLSSLHIVKEFINTNMNEIPKKMLNDDREFNSLIGNLLKDLQEFIANCEDNYYSGPITIDSRYIEVGNYEPTIDIDEIKTFFMGKTVKGIFYANYKSKSTAYDEQSQAKRELKISDFVESKTEARKDIINKKRKLTILPKVPKTLKQLIPNLKNITKKMQMNNKPNNKSIKNIKKSKNSNPSKKTKSTKRK